MSNNKNHSLATRNSGVTDISVFHNEFDDLINKVFGFAWSNPLWVTKRNYRFYDVSENDTQYTLSVELPGYKREELKLEVVDGSLQLIAENKRGRYINAWSLSDADLDKVTSKLEDGVLVVSIPKTPKTQPKAVVIE